MSIARGEPTIAPIIQVIAAPRRPHARNQGKPKKTAQRIAPYIPVGAALERAALGFTHSLYIIVLILRKNGKL